jgi:hypothetical protein
MLVRAVALALLLGVSASRPLAGQAPNHLYDEFQVSGSVAAVILGTTVRIDSDEGEGTEVDSEDDLGLESVALRPRIGFRWRPGRTHELEASYLGVSRSAIKTLEEDVTIDSVTYSAGAELDSRIGQKQLGIAYRWAIHAAERSQAGLSVGLGATFFDARWIGMADFAGGDGTAADTATVETDVLGPSLSIGGFGRWQLADRWYVEADLRGLYVPIDNIRIGIVEAVGAVRYFPLAWLGTELGYSLATFKVTIEQKEDPLIDLGASGKVKYNTQNLRLGLIATF